MKYRAVFFDRDNTLTYFNPEKERWRDETIAAWSGKPFELPYDKMMKLFSLASEGRSPWYRNLEDVTREIDAIRKAMDAGEASYSLQYSVKCKRNLFRTIVEE